MSLLAAPFATFLFFSGFAAAQIYYPVCTTLSSGWMLNSLGQNPCEVTANLMGTCYDGTFTVHPLSPGYKYPGPSDIQGSDLCFCNTVIYSLISACGVCQGGSWITWSEYVFNCTTVLPPSSFPNPLPLGIRVPQWALIDATSEYIWDLNRASAVGDLPEPTPGAILGHSTATVSHGVSVFTTSSASSLFGEATSTVKPASGASSDNSSSSSNTAVIVGGAVGGVVTISLVIVICFFLRRRRLETPVPVAPPAVGASQPPMDEIQQPLTMDNGHITPSTSVPGTIGSSMPGTPVASMRNAPSHVPPAQDLNYPSTFPEYQGVPQTPATPETPPQGAVPSYNTTGTSLATMQPLRQSGYHGLPMV